MSAPAPTPDLLLARRAAAGQVAAWDEIVELYGERIYNVALSFAASREEAEDLTQEVFLKLYRSLKSYRGDVPLVAWTLRLSRNLCIDHYRSVRTERRSTAVSDEILRWLPAADDPEAEALHKSRLDAVYGELAEMDEEHAVLVVLKDLQGWSLEEAAQALDLPLGTVKSRLHRARKELSLRVAARLEPPAARWEARP